jgi:O-antigen/teichoic acid export membrane protein
VSLFRILGRDLVAYGLLSGVSKSAHLLLLPVLTRAFSPAEYGVVDLIATLTGLLAVVMAMTMESAVARFWAGAGASTSREELVSGVLLLVVVVSVAIVSVVWLGAGWVADVLFADRDAAVFVKLGALTACLTALCNVPLIVLRMERRVASYSIITSLQTVGFVVLAVLIVVHEGGLAGVFAAQASAAGVAFVVAVGSIRRYLRIRLAGVWIVASMRFSLPLLPAVVVTWLNSHVDRMLLLLFLGLGFVGVFGAAARVASIMTLLVGIVRQAWTPLAMTIVDDAEVRDEFYRRAFTYYSGGAALVALLIAGFGREVMLLLVPHEFMPGHVIIPWLVGSQVLHGSAQFTNLGTLISKRTFENSVAAWCGVVVNVGLGAALIPTLGLGGAAIGAFVSSLVFTSLLLRYSLKASSVRFDLRRVSGILMCYVTASVAILVAHHVIDELSHSLIARSGIVLFFGCLIALLALDGRTRSALRGAMASGRWR